MKGLERAIAALLLAVAVAGGALIPRLLSVPARPLGVPLGPGPSRVVVQAPAITKARRQATPSHKPQPAATVPPAASAAPGGPVVAQPSPEAVPTSKPQHRSPRPSPPPTKSPPPPPPPKPPPPPP